MVIGVPLPKAYTQCKFLERFKSVDFGPFDEETRQWQRTLIQV